MPFLTVRILTGRTAAQKEALVHDLAAAMERHLEVSRERVQIIFHEIEREDWSIGGKPLSLEQEPEAAMGEQV